MKEGCCKNELLCKYTLAISYYLTRYPHLLRTLGLVESTVALLAFLHDLVAAERDVALGEAIVFSVINHRVQHSADVLHAAT